MSTSPTVSLPAAPRSIQLSNKARWNASRSASAADFYTVGYSGRSAEDLLAALAGASVSCLIDVRCSPVSMHRPEFSKRNLERRVSAAGITYLHVRELGVPRSVRVEAAETGDLGSIWRWYDAHVLNSEELTRTLAGFVAGGSQWKAALLCTELDPTACHRHRLALALELKGLRAFDL